MNTIFKTWSQFFIVFILFVGCKFNKQGELPILGRHQYIETDTGLDTIYHTISSFSFIDQDSTWVTNETYHGNIYVADFFFTSCPSICPIMKAQMLRVYEEFEDEEKVKFLSHTIDPDYDNVAVLSDYANRLAVKSNKWHFVTGEKEQIYEMAQTSYYIAARANNQAPGGYEHSGAFILIDPSRRIRGVYDGTDEERIDVLIADIKILLEEKNE